MHGLSIPPPRVCCAVPRGPLAVSPITVMRSLRLVLSVFTVSWSSVCCTVSVSCAVLPYCCIMLSKGVWSGVRVGDCIMWSKQCVLLSDSVCAHERERERKGERGEGEREERGRGRGREERHKPGVNER